MAVAYRNYAAYYTAPENDPFREDYSRVLSSFEPESTRTPVELLELVLTSTTIPQVFVTAAQNSAGETRIYLLHRPQRITAPLGGTSPWDGNIFATNGEVIGNLVVTVAFPTNPFNVCPATRIRSLADINQYFQDTENALFIPSTPAATAGSEECRARYVMYFPPAFITPELLNTHGTSPRRFWEVVLPLIESLDKLVECAPLVNWMRMSVSLHRAAVSRNVLPLNVPTLTTPMMDIELHTSRERIINQDLSGRTNQLVGVQESILQLAAVVADNTTKTISLVAEEKAKNPAKVWPQTLPVLMRYLEVDTDAALPPMYETLAKAAKQERRVVLQQAFTAQANVATAFCCQPIVVNLNLAKCILEFEFAASDPDILTQGLQPFILNLGNAEHRAKTLENVQQFDELEGGKLGLTLQDLLALKAADVKHVPVTFMELDTTLASFGDLLVVTLGAQHALLTAYRQFWREWQRSRLQFSSAVDIARTLKPVHILRRIQLELFYWFNSKRQALTPLPVEFAKIVHELHMATFTPPVLPPALFAMTSNPNSGSQGTPSALSMLLPSEPSGSNSMSDLSSITDFFTAFQQQHKQPPTRGSGEAIVNQHPDPDLDGYLAGNKIRVVCKPPFPQNSAKQDMCISYHAKGRCFALCGRSADHKPHSDKEKAILRSYVEAQVLQYQQSQAKKRAGSAIHP
jgi:hypothetical protein